MFLLVCDFNSHFIKTGTELIEREGAASICVHLSEDVPAEIFKRLELFGALLDPLEQMIDVNLSEMMTSLVAGVYQESIKDLFSRDSAITVNIKVLHQSQFLLFCDPNIVMVKAI